MKCILASLYIYIYIHIYTIYIKHRCNMNSNFSQIWTVFCNSWKVNFNLVLYNFSSLDARVLMEKYLKLLTAVYNSLLCTLYREPSILSPLSPISPPTCSHRSPISSLLSPLTDLLPPFSFGDRRWGLLCGADLFDFVGIHSVQQRIKRKLSPRMEEYDTIIY